MLPDVEQQLAAYARAAADLHDVSYGPDQFKLGATLATRLVPGCRASAILRQHRRTTETVAATSDTARAADVRARQVFDGAGMQALATQSLVVSADLRTDARWPEWSEYVAGRLGFAAVISLPLRTPEHSFGALTLYFDEPVADIAPVVARADALAKLLVLALTCGHKIEHQSVALEGRTVIGQAQGILMSQLDVSANDAFSHLQRLSQNGNRKLAAVAAEVVGDLVARRDQTTTGRPAGLGTAGVIHPPAADSRKA